MKGKKTQTCRDFQKQMIESNDLLIGDKRVVWIYFIQRANNFVENGVLNGFCRCCVFDVRK